MDDVTKTPPTSESPESSSTLDQELTSCRAQLQLWKEDCLRSRADFENYKKRVERDRTESTRLTIALVMKDLLPIIDDLERGLSYAQTLTTPEGKSVLAGLQLTYDQFKKILAKYGVTPIADTQLFDPMLHEAVMEVQSAEHPAGSVVQILQKGYMLQGQVLRPARVSIAKS